jgi:hypothetical protein
MRRPVIATSRAGVVHVTFSDPAINPITFSSEHAEQNLLLSPLLPLGKAHESICRDRRDRADPGKNLRAVSLYCGLPATAARRVASNAICGVKRLETASLQFSPRDARDRYLARRQSHAQALRRQSLRGKRHARRRSSPPPATTMGFSDYRTEKDYFRATDSPSIYKGELRS